MLKKINLSFFIIHIFFFLSVNNNLLYAKKVKPQVKLEEISKEVVAGGKVSENDSLVYSVKVITKFMLYVFFFVVGIVAFLLDLITWFSLELSGAVYKNFIKCDRAVDRFFSNF